MQRLGQMPVWVWGFLIGMVLIFLASRGAPAGNTLRAQFAPKPGDPTTAELPLPSIGELPVDLQAAQATAVALMSGGGTIAALTPVASTPGLRVSITSLSREQGGIRVRGSLTNVSSNPQTVPTEALVFQDSNGQLYGGSGSSAQIAPGQEATIDMTVPVPDGVGLSLILNLPPDPPVQMLLVAGQA